MIEIEMDNLKSIYGGIVCYFFDNAGMANLDDDLVVALGYFS